MHFLTLRVNNNGYGRQVSIQREGSLWMGRHVGIESIDCIMEGNKKTEAWSIFRNFA